MAEDNTGIKPINDGIEGWWGILKPVGGDFKGEDNSI